MNTYLLLMVLFFNPKPTHHYQPAQTNTRPHSENPRTCLWKVTGPQCSKPSYLLGTFHLTGADWLLEYPQVRKAVDSTEFILTEVFSTSPAVRPDKPAGAVLKALGLLDETQFRTLDSFFVARVGQGIRDNPEAAKLTVGEMEGAMLITLLAGDQFMTQPMMDLDLFNLYVSRGRKGDRLDRVIDTNFDSSRIDHARQYLARAIDRIKNSDKPDWNLYQMNNVDEAISDYKQMRFEYQLDQPATGLQTLTDFSFIPLEARNRHWMPKIIENITAKPTLIAVGLAHLRFETGLISLLRSAGYQVEPVLLFE
ncbi:TraB/GumN family protein [Dyadobacter crusticola]|uniref:TraB/GumN family protein n=1 Tax=Dyadobacter crusticola TaxID=292407 RepID=UPI0004E0FCEC|nr:TraB/GumN family protein [Dyadobacter crusticola]